MAEIYDPQDLDDVFEALANKHRREIIYVISLQPSSISQLASMRGLSLPAIHKHIKVLENAGMIIRRKIGRTNFLTLNRESLRGLQDWLMQYHTYWGSNEETLENYAQYLSRKNQKQGEKMKKFVLLTYGYETPTQEIMDAWSNWFASIGDKMVDSVGPFGPGREITHSGTKELPLGAESVTGYVIINADSLDEAEKIAQDCPIITSIRVYEAMSM